MALSPCIPSQLPLQSLKRERFVHLIPKAYVFLDLLNLMTQSSFVHLKKIIFLRELKVSKNLPGKALDLVLKKHPISLQLLQKLHRHVQRPAKDISVKDIGRIRNRQNWIGPENKGQEEAYFYPPDLFHLKKGLNQLQKYGKRNDEDPLIQLAIYFAQLLILHPFMDGNGRVARLMIPLFLYEKKVICEPLFFMSHYFKKYRVDYFHKLYQISSKQQWEEWICFFLKGVIEEGKWLSKQMENIK